ncbi:hypothetical protein DFR70_114104 [Nocardia tenerifensis]|uniref:Uncharacterized protein n=1 Tax=Nocardia tenerifensis TaxID=228006 RepID=A0A318JXM7_9NOCA|nr:hypothetical protein DFR70_114104 [Nocardia tenerifensis]
MKKEPAVRHLRPRGRSARTIATSADRTGLSERSDEHTSRVALTKCRSGVPLQPVTASWSSPTPNASMPQLPSICRPVAGPENHSACRPATRRRPPPHLNVGYRHAAGPQRWPRTPNDAAAHTGRQVPAGGCSAVSVSVEPAHSPIQPPVTAIRIPTSQRRPGPLRRQSRSALGKLADRWAQPTMAAAPPPTRSRRWAASWLTAGFAMRAPPPQSQIWRICTGKP